MSTEERRSGSSRAPYAPPPSVSVVAVIPARFESTRFPGKALADLCGKPMIVHVLERVRQARGVDAVLVATDDDRIADAVQRAGGDVRRTRPDHRSGTDRIAEVARTLDCDIVVNVQGDEPLIAPALIDAVIEPLTADRSVTMATLRRPITDWDEYVSPHVVKVTVDAVGDALYFSRAPIPAMPAGPPGSPPPTCHAHIGLYAFRRDFLLTFAGLPPTPLEQTESLEQLRALEHGFRIRTVPTSHATIGVDTPEDLARAREQLLLAAHR